MGFTRVSACDQNTFPPCSAAGYQPTQTLCHMHLPCWCVSNAPPQATWPGTGFGPLHARRALLLWCTALDARYDALPEYRCLPPSASCFFAPTLTARVGTCMAAGRRHRSGLGTGPKGDVACARGARGKRGVCRSRAEGAFLCAHPDLVEVALGLARRLDRGRQRRVVAEHEQAPAAGAVLPDHLLHVQLQARVVTTTSVIISTSSVRG